MRIVRGRGPSTLQPRSGDVGNDIGEKTHPTTYWILSVDDPLEDYFIGDGRHITSLVHSGGFGSV